MPRIDPSQLLKCLSVLLSSNGGIKSKDEVNRVANLMTKFSKKLVSKCIYVLILKSTEIDILDMFMSTSGWDLVFKWLSDGITLKNWSLVEEIVELLLLCPVNIQRLKGNNCPKIIKSLSKDTTASEKVQKLACKVVEQWLAIVRGACEATCFQPQPAAITEGQVSESTSDAGTSQETSKKEEASVYKITIRDGKQILAEVINEKTPKINRVEDESMQETVLDESEVLTAKTGRAARKSRMRLPSDDLSESESESSDEDFKPTKARKRIQSLKSVPKSAVKKTKNLEKQSSKEKSSKEDKKKTPTLVRTRVPDDSSKIEKKRKDSSSKVIKTEVKPLKIDKEMSDKDRATLAKLVTPSISSMGRIPKRSKETLDENKKKETKKEEIKEVKKEEKKPDKKPVEPPKPVPKDPKKYNYSTEIRKHDSERPKTVVKTFNSKFRSTGLEETPPPAKSSSKSDSHGKKSPKRSSPNKDVPVPEKKAKTNDDHLKSKQIKEEKITSPKPKSLQECDLFGDALTAANTFKDQKKRKRKTSTSSYTPTGVKDKESPPKKLHSIKEDPSDDEQQHLSPTPNHVETKPTFKFYQDTMETSDIKTEDIKKASDTPVKKEIKEEIKDDETNSIVGDEEIEDEVSKTEEAISKQLKIEEIKNEEREKNRAVSGILVYVKKRKSISKSVQWRPQAQLIETKFFELDENERVNVTKTFMDMKQMERTNEREQLMLSRKHALNDIMEEKIMWRPLIPIDIPGEIIEAGKNSLEKDIQFQRERTIVPAIYFNKKLIPDSPAEPDLEIHAITEPVVIPLLDQTGNLESVISYKSQGWPEPVESPEVPPQLPIPPQMPINDVQMPTPAMMVPPGPVIPPLMDFGQMPPTGFFPPQIPIGQGAPAGMMPPPIWVNNEGAPMMGPPPPDMMMGPLGMPPPDIAAQFGLPLNAQGMPPFMPSPQGFQPQQGPPPQMMQDGPPNRNNRPWNNNYQGGGGGGGGGGQWRKGRGGNDGGNWGRGDGDSGRGGGGGGKKSGRTCLNIIKRGYCKTPHCQFKHPPPYKNNS